jgi:hypothetical protein
MSVHSRNIHRRHTWHPNGRIIVPDPPEPWTPEEVEPLLWPNSLDHHPHLNREDGWPELMGRC